MAKASRINLFSREIHEHVSSVGVDLLLEKATNLSEGDISSDGHYYGSTMFTLDMEQLRSWVVNRCDIATAGELAKHLARDRDALERFAQAACAQVENITEHSIEDLHTEVRVRAEGPWLFIDVDLEGKALSVETRNFKIARAVGE